MRQHGAKSNFKRELVLGSKWEAYYHPNEESLGIREVVIVRTNAVAFKTENDTTSWLRFDDCDCSYTNPWGGCFQVYDGDQLILTYKKAGLYPPLKDKLW